MDNPPARLFQRIHPWWVMAAAWALMLALTKSMNLGDTRWYARNIVSFKHGVAKASLIYGFG